jgi:hypothetical protein
MSEMCINSIFQRFFPILLAKKKILPRLLLFLHGLFVYAFSIPGTNFIKKIPSSHFLVMRKKMPIWWPVGQLVGFLVCSSVGRTFVGHFGFFFVYYFHRQSRLLNIFRS